MTDPKPCPFCNGCPKEYQDGLAWTIRCCAVLTDVTRDKAIEKWNQRGSSDDPWRVRCPNCGRIGLLDYEQTVPTEGAYDYWMKCAYCKADVAIPIKGRVVAHD